MTTIKAIKAALAQKFTVSSIRENMKTSMSSPWDEELAWLLGQIEARDALLREYRDACNCDNGTVPCKLCERVRKVMEEK